MKRTVLATAIVLASFAQCGIANADQCKDSVDALERYGNKAYDRSVKAINSAPKLQGSGLEYYQAQCALKKSSLEEARESVKLNGDRSTACNYTKDKVDYWNKMFEDEVTQNQREMEEECGRAEEVRKREADKKK